LSGDLGELEYRLRELHHGQVGGVVRLGHAKDVNRDAERVGDMPQRADVTD
jgi:hypothetical protein